MFRELGQFITRRPLIIIAIWVILLIIMAPMAANLSDRLKYDSTSFMPKDTDSSWAQNVHDAQFPSSNDTDLIVVVESDNGSASAAFINGLNRTVINDTSIKNFSGSTSIYGMQRAMLVNMSPKLYKGLYEGYDNISDANFEMYNGTFTLWNASKNMYDLRDAILGINNGFHDGQRKMQDVSAKMYSARDQMVQGHDGLYQIKAAPEMIYGLPHGYVLAWRSANGSGMDDASSSKAAYNSVKAHATGPASAYLDAFNAAWTAAGYSQDPDKRAKAAISTAFGQFSAGITDPAQRGVFQAAYGSLTYDNYQAGEKSFCVNTAMAAQNLSASYKPQLEAVYDMGPTPSAGDYDNMVINATLATPGVPPDQAGAIRDVYAMGRNPDPSRIGEYLANKAISDTNDPDKKQLIREAYDLGNPTSEDIDRYMLKKLTKDMNESEAASVKEIYSWGRNPNNTTIATYALNKAMDGKNSSENRTILDIYNLGGNPSNGTVKAYVADMVGKNMNLTGGNNSYFLTLLNLDRNLTDAQVEAFADGWADAHGYDDPKIFPDQLAKSMVTGNVSLYMVAIDADSLKDTTLVTGDIVELRHQISALQAQGEFSEVHAYVTGGAAMSADTKVASADDMGNIDKFTILVVLILLLIYFRSILTPFVPLASIGIAIIGSMGAVAIVSYFMDLYYMVETMMVVVMMGAGIDYCVFMLSRYVEERREGSDVKTAVATTVQHAGKSIASSGMTAALGFGALALSGQGMFVSIGVGISIGLIISMITALTLMPAVLTLVGDRMFWPNKIYNVKPSATMTGLWEGLSSRVLKHSKVIVLLAVLIAVPTIYLASQLTTGMDMVSMLPSNIESKTGFNVLEGSMGSGTMSKAMITVTLPMNITDSSGNRTPEAMSRIENISAMISGIKDVEQVYSMTRPDGSLISYDNLSAYSPVEKAYYQSYMDNATGKDGRTTLIYASFNGSPYSNDAFTAIDQMRTMFKDNSTGTLQGVEFHVGGSSATNRDVEAANMNAFGVVLPIVIGGILIILFLLLRSIFLPLRIILTLSMSIGMAIAVFILIYQIGRGETMIFLLPIMLLCALMGMGVDYDIFLVSRIQEERFKGRSDREAIKKAISATGTIILICAFIMSGAFGTMMLSSMMMMQQIGFALSAGVIIDATLMLMVLVPAIMVLMGRWNWWPRKVLEEPPKAMAAIAENPHTSSSPAPEEKRKEP
ncbi:MAG TPA: MMPL family transporter [Methanocella sp.]|nr:MMPL family transporter [Methanocella sp.]